MPGKVKFGSLGASTSFTPWRSQRATTSAHTSFGHTFLVSKPGIIPRSCSAAFHGRFRMYRNVFCPKSWWTPGNHICLTSALHTHRLLGIRSMAVAPRISHEGREHGTQLGLQMTPFDRRTQTLGSRGRCQRLVVGSPRRQRCLNVQAQGQLLILVVLF